MNMGLDVGVLIVGAGPVGLTRAVELAHDGVPVRIIDKGPYIWWDAGSRGVPLYSDPLSGKQQTSCQAVL